jgi:ribonucleoside-diphosphate reductase beta chain
MIARDEGMHTDLAANLYREYIVNKLSQETVESMIREAVAIEDEFINVAVPCKLVGMNSELMSDYIRFVSDRILLQLGHSTVFNAKNGFPFMERAGMVERINFFEARNHNYSMATSVNDRVGASIKADGNDDF